MQVSVWRSCLLGLLLSPATGWAQGAPPPADESALGEFVVTGTVKERVTTLAVLPSLSPDLEDVVVRSVVRHDFELSGMFDVIPDRKAPPGNYDFDDPVDVDAWKKVGAEVIVKVAARKSAGGKVEVYGIAYFLSVGKEPVYQKKLLVDPSEVRVTAHRVTDALLGAITGRPGGFASHFTFSSRWARTEPHLRDGCGRRRAHPHHQRNGHGHRTHLGSRRLGLLRSEQELRSLRALSA